jgi:hypothetical protein
MVCAPFAQMPEDLQAVACVRAELFGRPEDAHLARPCAVQLARAAVPLQILAQILEKAWITHFDSHAVPNIGTAPDGRNPPLCDCFENPLGDVEVRVNILHVVVFLERIHQAQELARSRLLLDLNSRPREHGQLR